MNVLSRNNQIEQLFLNKFKLNPEILNLRRQKQHLSLVNYLTDYFAQTIIMIEGLLKTRLRIEFKPVGQVKKFIKKLLKPTNNSQIINIFRQYIVTLANYRQEKSKFQTLEFARIYSMIVRCLQQFNTKEDIQFIQALSTMTQPQLAEHIKRNSKAGTYSFKPLQQRSLRQQLIQYGLKIKAISSPSHSTLYSGTKKVFYEALTHMANQFRNKFKIDMSKSYYQYNSLQKLFQDIIKVDNTTHKQSAYLRKWLTKSYIAISGDKQLKILPRKIPTKMMIRIYRIFLRYKKIKDNDIESQQQKKSLWSHLDDWKIKELLKEQITYKDIASLFKMQRRNDKKLCQRRIMIRTKSLMTKAIKNIFYLCYKVDQIEDEQMTQMSIFLLKNLVNGCLREDIEKVLKFQDNQYKDEDEARQILELVRSRIFQYKQKDKQRMERQRQETQLKRQRQKIKQEQDRYQREGPSKDKDTQCEQTIIIKEKTNHKP